MEDNVSRDDFETAVLRNLLEINQILNAMVEFQEKMGEAIELLASEMGYQFSIKEDAEA